MKHLPLPIALEDTAAIIRAWARAEPDVDAVFLHGARVTGIARPDAALDVAVTVNGAEADDIFAGFLLDGARWQAELAAATGLPIVLSLAHPEARPRIWRLLHQGCVPLYPAA